MRLDVQPARDLKDADRQTFVCQTDPHLCQGRMYGYYGWIVKGTFIDSSGKENDAVMKLSSNHAERQSEHEVYQVLHENNVPHIPQVYVSGIIDRWDNQEFECVVMEAGGEFLDDYLIQSKPCSRTVVRNFNNAMTSVLECIWRAQLIGILHRDISMGNVLIDGSTGKVMVIDWGMARVNYKALATHRLKHSTQPPPPGLPYEFIIRRIEREAKVQEATERKHDNQCGTFYYISIRLHCGYDDRGILDDMESVFYVFTYALSKRFRVKDDKHIWRELKDIMDVDYMAVDVKVGAVRGDDIKRQALGINTRCPSAMFKSLQNLHRCLFLDGTGGRNLAIDLVSSKKKDPRPLQWERWLEELGMNTDEHRELLEELTSHGS